MTPEDRLAWVLAWNDGLVAKALDVVRQEPDRAALVCDMIDDAGGGTEDVIRLYACPPLQAENPVSLYGSLCVWEDDSLRSLLAAWAATRIDPALAERVRRGC